MKSRTSQVLKQRNQGEITNPVSADLMSSIDNLLQKFVGAGRGIGLLDEFVGSRKLSGLRDKILAYSPMSSSKDAALILKRKFQVTYGMRMRLC